ncbi:hypothetical protein M5D96_008865 [Drosophila gunungcola]|uniref:adenylate cyclase n=2 Tax=Drosophila gunungcola TaxID=103775 RepID=A0A9P9YJU0_9MUSC|nr:hypothetical protein M5D96_008865 [Drosophila gunungcola]
MMLLDSILSPQIAKPIKDSIKNKIMLEFERSISGGSQRPENFMAIQVLPDVSILSADVVELTTQLTTMEKLVKVLYDLFARFDVAASHFQVQRLKFLGACYYCVTDGDPDHAKVPVSLGISMIANIQEVRYVRH